MFIDFVRVDWDWGCPLSDYAVQYSIDGDSRGFDWYNLMFNVLFWVLYFTLLGLGGGAILRKVGLNIRPGFCLIALWVATVLLYAHLYRPDRLINLVTGGYLGFLESRNEQVDLAMRFGDVETLQALFSKHPELAYSVDPAGNTPLHKAAYYGESSIVRLLLADKADVEAKDNDGGTPLFKAALGGWTGAAELLIKNGAKVNARLCTGETPLVAAAESGKNRVVLLLLANKANVNAQDSEGRAPLHAAVTYRNTSTAQLLIASNADVNMSDNDGETPLFFAVKAGDENTAELLLLNGAEPDVVNKDGEKPIQVALDYGCTNIVEILKKHGGLDDGHLIK